VGPTAIADANTGIDIGGSSLATGNIISNFGTTGTFSAYALLSGTVNGILVRNSNGINISYNSITSSNGGVTAGTLNGIQVQASTNAPTATFTNTITYNTISLQSGAATGGINGITYPSGSASATSIANVTNNDFTRLNHSVASSGTIVALSKASGDFTTNITNNTFTNLTCNTTGSFTFISHSITMPTGGTQTISGNSIVTGFNKTGAGGTVTCLTSAGSSINGTTATINNNNFSNITITGATAITGISSTDYLSASSIPTKIITNNIFNSWTGGTSAYTGLTASYWAGNSSVNTNTFTNWSGQGAITAINLGSTGSIATSINISNNTINNLSSTGTGGSVTGITSANTSTVININGNAINTLSSTGVSSTVAGIIITGAATTNVFSNTIYGIVASGITAPLALGVSVQGGTTVNTYGNKIYNISATGAISTTSPAVVGLNITGGSTVNSYNNLIGDLKAPAASLADAIRGISIPSATSTTRNIYNNSIYLNASSTGTNFGTSGIYHIGALTATTSALNLQNNIIVNNSTAAGTGLTVAFRKDQPVYTNNVAASNKNLFYAGTPSASNLLLFDGSNSSQTMSAFQTAVTPREANSFTEASFNPATFFVSTTGSDANYLKPAAGITTQAEGGGNTIAMTSPDYNGVTRPGGTGTSFDLGAWEFEGISPAPVLTTLVAAPSLTPQCTKADRAITIDVTTTSGTITSVVLNYSHNGVAQTPVTMTNSTGNTYTGTMIAPTTGNATVTWSISATNSIGLTSVFNGTSYADEPTTGVTATATASVNPICSGNSTSLSMSVSRPGSITLGTGTALTGATTQPTAFCNRWPSYRMQTIYTAADLTSSGLSAGNISAMAFNITTLGDGATNANFTVRIGTTSQSTFATTAWLTPTYTTVFPAATYTHTASGWQTINFSTPYSWDGISNLIIDIQYDGANATNNSITYFTATTGNTVLHSDTSGKAAATGVLSTTRLNVQFTGNVAPSVTAYSWSDGASIVGTTNPLVVSPTAATTYTGTATVAGCPMTASTLVNVNPLPTAPTVTASTQCGLAVPTASVADPNSFTTPTFKWYDAATAGTLLQTSTSTTYTTAISTSTTFYVSVINPTTGCESARTPVTVTVNAPDPIAATANDTSICLGESVTLTGANTASTPTQTYTYSWLSTANSGLTTAQTGTSISVTPDTVGLYIYTATASGGGCQTTATVSVTVNALPNINSATASNTVSCVGNTINLAATASDISAGTSAPSGTGTSYTSASGYPTFFGNYWRPDWSQMVYTATELQAMGLAAGDITSITFNIGALPDPTTVNGYSISLGATSNNTLSAFQTTGLTTVYGPVNHTVTAAGNVTINFTTPYNWDGSSNIIVDVRGTGQWANANATTQYTTTTGNTVVYAYSSPANATFWTSNPTPTTSTSRPNIKFGGQVETNTTANYAWTWSDGTATVLTAATGSVVLSASATYTATATNTTTGCASNSLPIAVTANPLPTAPTTTDSTQCGLAVPTASVADPNSFTTPTFKWYDAATAGTLLQTSTSTTYTTAISATTTFYVSVVNPTTGCESARTAVTVTVSQPDTIGATANDNSICLGESVTLTAANTASTPTQNYAYSWISTANSGLTTAQTGASISVTPDTIGSYIYTVTAAGGACQTTATVTVTVSAVPNINSATASTAIACAGSTINLAATASDVNSGTATLGAGAITPVAYSYDGIFEHFYGGNKTQFLVTAAELTAIGVTAGDITSVGIDMATVTPQAYAGFAVSVASTADANMSAGINSTATFSPVFSSASYTPTTGVNTFNFSTPYNWDGSSNIIIQFCWSNNNGGGTTNYALVDTQSYVSTAYYRADNRTPNQICGGGTATGTTSRRPKFIFGGQIETNTTANYTWTWSDGSTTVLTAASGSV
ncbi:MAG: beta strand repeat-containing protein, partial [Dolichospermum sp.]